VIDGDPSIRQPRPTRTTLVAAAIPLVVYLAFAGIRVYRNPPPNFDERIFLDVGRQIVDTGLPMRTVASTVPTLFFDHTPLYVYIVAGITALGGTTEVVRAVTLVAGALTVLLVFRLGLEVRGVASAFVAAILLAANPFFASYGWFVRMEVPMCFFMVLGLYLLQNRHAFLSGLAIAAAVMLKEVALAFWLVAGAYATIRDGWRVAMLVVAPSVIAFAGWVVYALSIGSAQFFATMDRWLFSAQGADVGNARLNVGLAAWTRTLVATVIGPLLLVATGAAMAFVIAWNRRIPPITLVPIAYVPVALFASYIIRLKEPRFVIAVVPMLAIAIGLAVDWDEVRGTLLRRYRGRTVFRARIGSSTGA
jgi:dolichyl-phosphate-mannose-protein mannosyltransferase